MQSLSQRNHGVLVGMARQDSEIPIIDAIAYAEWLRSWVASHAVNELTGGLSPYDVVNVQHVARRLLLKTIGYWRWQEDYGARVTVSARKPTRAPTNKGGSNITPVE